ncbi:MAG: EAL domain-containing protein [Proteobacteria bacterium]|nr:EAL domain-containing protein [Pseudomonadota bacterium]
MSNTASSGSAASAAPAADAPLEPAWLRLHRAFMPDYNRKATAYWWIMALLGTGVLAHALRVLEGYSASDRLQVAAGVAIAMLAGFFPVRVPRSKNSFAAGEIFIFLLLLLHGPAAATLAAAGEGLIGSWRTSKRWTSRLASPAMACVAMFAAGSALHAMTYTLDSLGLFSAALLLIASMLCAVLYFMLNTVLLTAVPYLKRNQWPTVREMFGNFGWIGITYAGSASVACLLFLTFKQSGIGVLMAAAPIIAMLLSTLHYFFRQQEADEQMRRGRVEAIEREAELAARHVRELEVSERRFHSAFTHASIGMALVAFDGRILQANAALRALLGVDSDHAIAQHLFSDFVDAVDGATLNEQLVQLNAQRIPSFTVELRLDHRQGHEVWAAVHGSFFSEVDSAAPCLILQVQDTTARRQAEAGLQHLAFHDTLTGLPNRRRFHDQLGQALEQVKTHPRRQFGLMFLDFDRFKLLNDSLGHAAGDEFLVQVARRIRDHVRPRDIVARLGGDEFAILADDLDGERYAVTLAERLLELLAQPFQIAGTEITTSASIGITFSAMGYATPAEMLRDADTAMYKAKAAGKARYALFDNGLHTEVAHRLKLEGDLRRALGAGQLSVAYQPLFDLSTNRITGFEALARWEHAELGAISPTTFIPVAEDAGLMMPLTDFVLRSACRQLRQWQLVDDDYADLVMHVNVSGNDIAHSGLIARVNAALKEARLAPQHLTLELTENILMERLESALPMLTELRRLGIGLSVDDFGTGYSSLRHLSSLPVSSLKIDRAFVADLQRGSDEAAVVRAIVLLGNSLGKHIIAEGIETPAQAEQLRQMGCAAGQGFHLSRPLSTEMIDRMLDAMAARNAAPVLPSFMSSAATPLLH